MARSAFKSPPATATPQLKITNSGPVIPAGQVTGLLQPFQRWPASRTAHEESLGMGLPIIAAIAKAHHARLAISPGPHGGLDIDITFPRPHPGKTGKEALVPAWQPAAQPPSAASPEIAWHKATHNGSDLEHTHLHEHAEQAILPARQRSTSPSIRSA